MKRILGTVPRRALRLIAEYVVLLVFVWILLPLLWIVSPVCRIRIGCILSDRIGHIAADVDLFMRKLQLHGRPTRTFYVFLCGKPAANEQLVRMWKRRIRVIRSSRLQYIWQKRLLPIAARTPFHEPLQMQSNEHYEFSQGEPSIEFTTDEENLGQDLLRRMGVPSGSWFICVHARDPSYLALREGFGSRERAESFVDCSIQSFFEAMHYIVGRGGYVIRVGAAVETPLPDLGARIIDYATHHRSDFMDIYLPAKCRFFLGSTSGLFGIPLMFNVPLAITNYCPYIFTAPGRDTVYLPKLLRRRDEKTLVAFAELKALGLLDENTSRRRELRDFRTYDDLGLEWVDNSPEEIVDLCRDVLDRLEGRPAMTGAKDLQKSYINLYSGPNRSPYSGQLGPRFALSHRTLIETSVHG
jgi:putative glycosyltransferase (TIGR04372 family)